ncbi:hypothetical protein K435DRAFT_873612 [Dendrothele bispora CBS 962.96]|uniref:Retrotransposon Copia-like N-terminal domain-containing protein n=1 Tax=Dendrothele bispora (strain CBS 962.96) TaxID=1314807 RepID=A0A4S8KYP1_DENBC|nr:hypothetical protein K435DRAFT_873612 [Dendrothele bispora CBS 962.96]
MTSSTEDTHPSTPASIVSLLDHPIVIPLPSPSLFKVEYMSTPIVQHHSALHQNHFSSWKRQSIQTLRINQGADGYLDGRILCPNADTEPRTYSNWNANNGSILGFMGLVIDDAEQEIIEGANTAQAAWTLLTQRHAQEGPVKQLTTLNKRIWDMGSLSLELFLCIIMINSMSNVPDLLATCENVAQQFAQSDGTNPNLTKNPTTRKYDSSDIKPIGHTKDYCVSPGGGMAGKTIAELRDARLKDREKKGNGTSGEVKKPNYHVVESNGQAYIIDVVTNTVLRTIPSGSATPSDSTSDFAGLACDSAG